MKRKERGEFESPLVDFLEQNSQDAYGLLALGHSAVDDVSPGSRGSSSADFAAMWPDARSIADCERFLHWEVAFPGVWHGWQDVRPQGGFHAVIGNPPWDRIEQQEVEWFAIRDSEVALASTGAMRKALIDRRMDEGDELALEYVEVRKRAATIRALARFYGEYPLLSGGRTNLYSLFIERAMGLVKPDGFVALLTPSGIYSDMTAVAVLPVCVDKRAGGRPVRLREPSSRDRPAPFFPDVDGRFKFCVLVFSGEERRFAQTECAFFLHDLDSVKDLERCFPLTPDDFSRVNPNTGTAPVFRTRRDAEITHRIYERHPVLVDRSYGG